MPRSVPVRIEQGPSGIEVDPARFHVSKSHNDEVVWTCDSGDFTVNFKKGSPFATSTFNSVAGSVRSGPAVVPPGGLYPYEVTLTSGLGGDPDGAVDP